MKSIAEPLCPVFGTCGGCAYQNIPYQEELRIKETGLRRLFKERLHPGADFFEAIVPSPEPYHYRNRLDLTLRRKKKELIVGFQLAASQQLITVDACAIARKEISDYVPALKIEAAAGLPADYRTANLVVKTGEDGRVRWGGIGRGSLRMKEPDYFYTVLRGRKIFYSLETFFQANLSILPALIEVIENDAGLDKGTCFLDLYSGVGLFGLCFADQVQKVLMIEENSASTRIAEYAARCHGLLNVEIHTGRVETELPAVLNQKTAERKNIAIVDPPRRGLMPAALETLSGAKQLQALFYLSCYPESLVRDLAVFLEKGWKIQKVIPFDFFPKTSHLETLVFLKP